MDPSVLLNFHIHKVKQFVACLHGNEYVSVTVLSFQLPAASSRCWLQHNMTSGRLQ